MSLYDSILPTLIDADLAPKTERIALRLLVATDDNGHLILSWESLCALTGCNNINAARRHLSRLANCQPALIHYSTNDNIYIYWYGAHAAPNAAPDPTPDPTPDHKPRRRHVDPYSLLHKPPANALSSVHACALRGARSTPQPARTDTPERHNDLRANAHPNPPSAQMQRPQRTSAPKPARRRAKSPDPYGYGGGIDPLPDQIPTNQPTMDPNRADSDSDSRLPADLTAQLQQADVDTNRLPRNPNLSPADYQRICRQWLYDHRTGTVQPGALVHRIKRGWLPRSATPPALPVHAMTDTERLARYEIPDHYRDIIIG